MTHPIISTMRGVSRGETSPPIARNAERGPGITLTKRGQSGKPLALLVNKTNVMLEVLRVSRHHVSNCHRAIFVVDPNPVELFIC